MPAQALSRVRQVYIYINIYITYTALNYDTQPVEHTE